MKNNQFSLPGINITRLHLIVFYFFCANFSVLSVSLFRYLHEKASKNAESFLTDLTPSAIPYFNIFLFSEMAFYIISSILIGISVIIALYVGNRPHKFSFFSEYKLKYCILFTSIICIIGCLLKSWVSVLIPIYILSASLFYPKMIFAIPAANNSDIEIETVCKKIHIYIVNILFFICCAVVVFLFFPQIYNKPVILNPYLRIPEQFKFFKESEGEKTTAIDNTTIINDLNLFNGHEKIDIINSDWHNNAACYEIPVYNQALEEVVEVYQWKSRLPLGSFSQASNMIFYPMLFYRDNYLCVVKADGTASFSNQIETVNKELVADISSVLGKDFGERLEQDIQKGFIHSNHAKMTNIAHQKISLSDRLNLYGDKSFGSYFIKKSIHELIHQLNFRGQFKHHIYYLFPSYEYLQGKPLNQIYHQYGLGIAVIPALIAKIFNSGEPNYGSAINLISIMYYIAFFSLIISIFYITRDLRTVILSSLIYIYNQVSIGYDVTLFTFGVNELRVFCSIPMMLAVYLYYIETTWKRFLFMIICSFCSMFINFEFGLMITAATLGTLIIQLFLSNKFYLLYIVRILLMLFCIFISEKLFNIGFKNISNNFLSGVLSFKLSLNELLLLTGQLFIYFIFFIHMLKERSKFSFVFLYSAFLSQEFLTYYIWCGTENHLFMYFTRLILPIVFYINFIFSLKEKFSIKINFIFYALIILSIVCIVKKSENYYHQFSLYKDVIKNYIIYQWDIPGTSISSTINPEYLSPSLELISKYSSTEDKQICLISQYDSLFMFLAKKISMLPVFDLVAFLQSEKEKMVIEETIKQKQPEYLFVDNDILGPYELDIAPVSVFGEFLHLESRLRVFSLKEMCNIFLKIKDDYELIESSNILSVYRRKSYE